jgi:peptide-methionine (S)-S-oxide reductase
VAIAGFRAVNIDTFMPKAVSISRSAVSVRLRAMQGRIAFKKHFAPNSWRRVLNFAKALGLRARPRVAFFLRFAMVAAGFVMTSPALSGGPSVAYFAGGCFWCTEAVFERAPGVTSVVSGYMQGAETIQITFDSGKTSYDKLLNLFWRAHDPTEVDSQGPDVGKQYRSAIFFVDEQQRAAAEKSKAQVQKSYSKPIATEITRSGSFHPARENHQNFCMKNPNNPYVRQIIDPKLQKLGLKKSAANRR